MREGGTVCVETYARLHFGVLDLRGSEGRWFGGIGAAASAPSLWLSASRADALTIEGDDADRAAAFARQFLDYHHVSHGAFIQVHRALPPHAGLGSGTQLALAIGRALADLYDLDARPAALAHAMNSDRRSVPGHLLAAVSLSKEVDAPEAANAVLSSPGCRFPTHGAVSSSCRRDRRASAAPMKPTRSRVFRSRQSRTFITCHIWCS
jgi:hypothetical protein